MSMFAQPACAASFDCAKASTKVEKMICADPELSQLDEKLSLLYQGARKKFIDLDSIKQDQRAWLKRRNDCVGYRPNESMVDVDLKRKTFPVICIKTAYRERIGQLDPYSVTYKLPIRIKDLGENWQFEKDTDKLPIILKAMASGRLKAPPPTYNTEEFCKTFPEDLIAGRNIEVIEPDMKIMERNDPRLGARRYTDVGTKRVWKLSRDDPKVGHWYRCEGINSDESTASHPRNVFTFFDLVGLLPYHIYRVELDGNSENGPEDVLLYREYGNGFSHDYYWVDLNGCEIKQKIQNNSPAHWLHPENKDALSLMLRYKGKVMVLRYTDFAKKTDSEEQDTISINSLANPRKGCTWGDPFGTIWKGYERSLESAKSRNGQVR